MQTRRWLSPSQPETLRNATILLYLDGVFSFIGGSAIRALITFPGLVLLGIVGAAAAYAMANDRKIGYQVAVGVAAFRLLLMLVFLLLTAFGALSNIGFIVNFLFEVVLVVLLLHAHSKDYARIWFK